MYSELELREFFHFCFLEQLLKISDPKLYVLKGGVNIRFFFNSPRYSEDMDIDVLAGSVSTLKKNGYKVLENPGFKRKLKAAGIEDILINDPNTAKHTDTTQRFKVRLVTKAFDLLPTKIEFSRRNKGDINLSSSFERIDTDIARKFHRLSFLVQHYDSNSALIQKIKALAGRKEVQARDVFDIFILDIGGSSLTTKLDKKLSEKAKEALVSINYSDYKTKVLEFLHKEDLENYSGKDRWQEIQERALEIIER